MEIKSGSILSLDFIDEEHLTIPQHDCDLHFEPRSIKSPFHVALTASTHSIEQRLEKAQLCISAEIPPNDFQYLGDTIFVNHWMA